MKARRVRIGRLLPIPLTVDALRRKVGPEGFLRPVEPDEAEWPELERAGRDALDELRGRRVSAG